ncbi:aspartate/glutamate racemase family protein [Amycolatopsis sp. GM8]|uniref:aspartate/glutamate racemase family protein n=1 Tax=Amycolatopsis sp. GM8 TaxID=2896530 RepID=UPI001F382805|nr:aspartate/glutamate racemase family protein [Amycolatopsis sp. GM8]
MSPAPKIALINAVPAAIPPAQAALHDSLPDAVVWNILDDRLLVDADSRGGLDAGLRRRMRRLIDHALAEDADGVLLTCSLYGPVAQGTHAGVPVMASDEAAFADIARAGYASVLVLASFDGARDDTVRRLETALREAGASSRVVGLSVPAAMDATKAGDHDALVTALVKACANRPADAVYLAQYSLAPAGNALQEAVGVPVISGPKSAAAALRRLASDGHDR